jgi:demethylmenaquinone methyltransferase/2-methoxy-6-polyprenyl-1,4-benzoquinol methylase
MEVRFVSSPPGHSPRLVQELFRGISDIYDPSLLILTPGFDALWKRGLRGRLAHTRPHTLLDVATGTGIIPLTAGRVMRPPPFTVGLDVSLEMLRVAMRKALSRDDIFLVRGLAEHLPIADHRVDVVTSCYLLKYCDIHSFFREVQRVLKPGGLLISYEFCHPRSHPGIPARLYIFTLLPLLSKLLSHIHRGLGRVLAFLPEAIKAAHWEAQLRSAVGASGLTLLESQLLPTGAARLVVCGKPTRPRSMESGQRPSPMP